MSIKDKILEQLIARGDACKAELEEITALIEQLSPSSKPPMAPMAPARVVPLPNAFRVIPRKKRGRGYFLFSVEQEEEIRRYALANTTREAAKKYSCSPGTVANILARADAREREAAELRKQDLVDEATTNLGRALRKATT